MKLRGMLQDSLHNENLEAVYSLQLLVIALEFFLMTEGWLKVVNLYANFGILFISFVYDFQRYLQKADQVNDNFVLG